VVEGDRTPVHAGKGRLTRNLAVLSGVSFLQDAASELLYPVLPIFLTGVLGAPAVVVGMVEGLAAGVASLATWVTGAFGDRFARRPLIGVGYGLAALGKVLIALATVWPVVLAGRAVDRLGKGVRGAPRDALLVEGIPASARGRAFGLHRAADTLGAVIGPLLGLLAYELLDHRIRPLLVVAAVPAVLSVLLVAATREVRRSGGAGADGAGADGAGADGAGALPRRFWRAVVVLAGFSLVNFPDALLLLRLSEIGFSITALILAYVTYNLVYALASYPAGVLADRLSRHRVFGVGLLFFGVGYLGLGLVHDRAVAWLLMGAYGLFAACTDGVARSWVSVLVGAGQQSRAQGMVQGMTGGGVLLAGLWAGLAWSDDGQLPLLLSGTIGSAFAVLLLVTPRSHWIR
jgi:MFS family permease